MTKAEILAATRYLINENSGDSGALLSDTGNLLEFIQDAQETVVLDCMPFMKGQLCTKENVTLIAETQSYTLTASYWMVYKVARNTTGDSPKELTVINPYQELEFMDVGETADEPDACYFLGDTMYFCPKPAVAATDYCTVWLIRPEAATMATGGPAYLPVPAHRLIVYQAAALAATMIEKDPSPFYALYARRLAQVRAIWAARFQSRIKTINESVGVRSHYNAKAPYDYDTDWDA